MCAAWLLAPALAFAQDADAGVSAEELEAIERALSADAEAQPNGEPSPEPAARDEAPAPRGFLQSLNPDISFIADVAAAWFSADEPLQTGGHDPTATGFMLQALEMAVGKSVDPYFRFDANIVFNLEGVEIEEAYATTLSLPGRTQLRIGQFLTRFGRINSQHPHTWKFVDQPFPIGRVLGGEGNRGLGAEVSWLTPLPWSVELIGSVTDANGRSFLDEAEYDVEGPLDLQYAGAVKQFFPASDDVSILWGLSAATGPNASGDGTRTDIYGTDLYVKFRPISDPANPTIVSLEAEVFYRRRGLPDARLEDVNAFAQLFWRFSPRWGVAARYEVGTGDLAGSGVEDPLDPEWGELRQRVSANLTFWPTEFSRVRLQGRTGTGGGAPDHAVMLSFEFSVGAHGAHAF